MPFAASSMLLKEHIGPLLGLALVASLASTNLAPTVAAPAGSVAVAAVHAPAMAARGSAALPAIQDAFHADVLTNYIAERWRIEEGRARRVVSFAKKSAAERAVDPLLVLAVIARESAFKYVGNPGDLSARPTDIDPLRPHGLMQVSGRWHPEKMPTDGDGNIRKTTASENIDAGVMVLSEYLAREDGNVQRALQRYNGNLADARSSYAERVLRVKGDFEQVLAQGG